eukprot:SAG11_NODE_8359_length_1025_cov_1.044276_2_plen_57_part_00
MSSSDYNLFVSSGGGTLDKDELEELFRNNEMTMSELEMDEVMTEVDEGATGEVRLD